ncbi:SET domain containing 8 isoform X4 [Augochlora pura]
MDTFEADMFDLSDQDLPVETSKYNPIEEHLMKQYSDVQARIEKTINDIKDVHDTTRRVQKRLQDQAQYGGDITSDSDSDMYTINGQPVVAKKQQGTKKRDQILIVQSSWKRILWDKWIIGVVLRNASTQILYDPQFYIDIKGSSEVSGSSSFWSFVDSSFWCRTDTIQSRKKVVATVVLDLPKFDENRVYDVYGTVLYEVDEKQYQTSVPCVRFSIEEMIENSCGIKFTNNAEQYILTVKSMSIEKVVDIEIEQRLGHEEQLLTCLAYLSFKEICSRVYSVETSGCLMFCLIEILSLNEGRARLRIFSKSSCQMNIILRVLRDQFPHMTVQDNDNCVHAAMALLEELKLYVRNGSTLEQQMARVKTDLLIS